MKDSEFDFYSKSVIHSYNLNSTMRYQLSMLDRLDNFTRLHCENVANLTCRICEYLKCQQDFTVYCTTCAYLHDIGKLFIPPEVLQKPGSLTQEEYQIMKTHTTLGYKLCMEDLQLRPYAKGTLYHHEALDGSGYPNGVCKEDIPYEGQIIRVADEYDAIVSKRQYKSHIGISDTLQIIINETLKPSKDAIAPNVKDPSFGKINPVIANALLKVVIDDIEYEITVVYDYIEYLQKQIKRLEKVQNYCNQMNKSKYEEEKKYYCQEAVALLAQGETLDNYLPVIEEYKDAIIKRNTIINNLDKEIKIIKKMKV